MLSWDEEDFLKKIPIEKKVVVKPFDPLVKEVASGIIEEIQQIVPELNVRHMGASALEISGQNDVDIYILCEPEKFEKYIPKLIEKFGEPQGRKYDSVSWEFLRKGIEIEMYLTDPNSAPMKRQIAIFDKLQASEALTAEYRDLKDSLNGKPFKDYQRAKYEFYHKVLGE